LEFNLGVTELKMSDKEEREGSDSFSLFRAYWKRVSANTLMIM
jgi:hypothetical protein